MAMLSQKNFSGVEKLFEVKFIPKGTMGTVVPGEEPKPLPEGMEGGESDPDLKKFEELYPDMKAKKGAPEYATAFETWKKGMTPNRDSALQEESVKRARFELGPTASQEAVAKRANEIYFETSQSTPLTYLGPSPSDPSKGMFLSGKGDRQSIVLRDLPGGGAPGPKTLGRLPATEAKELAQFKTIGEDVRKVKEAWNTTLTGPFRGNVNLALSKVKDSPEFEALRRRVNRLITVAYALSGKQISYQEMEMLKTTIIPSVKQMDKNFLVAVDELDDWIRRARSNATESYKIMGYDIPDSVVHKTKDKPTGTDSTGGISRSDALAELRRRGVIK